MTKAGKRLMPEIMCSQHPDHASVPWWGESAYIQTHDEIDETFLMFEDLGTDEVMWDWEGKLVDESVIEKLLIKYGSFFADNPLGVEKFLTFRVPNPRVEPGYRLARAFMVMLSAHQTAREAKLPNPLFEAIVPMVESADDLTAIYQSYVNLSSTVQSEFGHNVYSKQPLELIPIFESVEDIMQSDETVKTYIGWLQENYGVSLEYFRPFCARSDPAMNAGIIPTTLAIKWALSRYAALEEELGIKMYPIIAPGSLLFRGGLRPDRVQEFMQEYGGIQTAVIQSAFRYDFDREVVSEGVEELRKLIQERRGETQVTEGDKEMIDRLIEVFSETYRQTVEQMIPLVQQLAVAVPRRRDRMQHIGLFGYSRQMGEASLPRAIGFTCTSYSMGLPAELWGLGAGLKQLEAKELKALDRLYPSLRSSLREVGGYVRKESVEELELEFMKDELTGIEEFVGEELGAKNADEEMHAVWVEKIVEKILRKEDVSGEVEQAAKVRRSVG